jgi:hypothetical protein
MSNPVDVPLAANTWVLVAENVTTGNIYKTKNVRSYIFTTRETGDPAPTDNTKSARAFRGADRCEISSLTAIDVYFKSMTVDGQVMVIL